MKNALITCLIVLTATVFLSCGDDDHPINPVIPEDSTGFGPPPSWLDTIIVDTTMISRPPLPDAEAEWLALYLSRDLMAPLDLYERVHRDLEAIRSTYADLDPPLKGRFRTLWEPGRLRVGLTDEAVDRYLAGTYTDLDELNRLFRLQSINDLFVEDIGSLSLRFGPMLHPGRLIEFYRPIESLKRVGLSTMCCDGDRIYPWYAHGKLTYLFKDGEGDCPAGCTENRYWYFRTDDDGNIEYVGTFADWDFDTLPAWWLEALRNREAYREWY